MVIGTDVFERFMEDNELADFAIRCTSDEELYEALNVALVVGGSIVIPHLRHAFETIDLLRVKVRSK